MATTLKQNPLNTQALTLEKAQDAIRLAVKDGFFLRTPSYQIAKKVGEIIKNSLEKIKIPALRDAARRSLMDFYNKAMNTTRMLSKKDLIAYLALGRYLIANKSKVRADDTVPTSSIFKSVSLNESEQIIKDIIPPGSDINNYASAMNMYHKDYKQKVKDMVDRLAAVEALDPDSQIAIGQRQTLRARAEREVRYQGHQDEIAQFKSRGVKLVIISAHANCSPRCAPFQGKVFSLDGTSGTTSDGRKYEPLEKATDIRTPNGKWFNGLFGFNCRHYMVEYKRHYRFPTISEKEEKKQYRIDLNMRRMERQIREVKTEALMHRGLNTAEYKRNKVIARTLTKKYENYANKHGRVALDSRITTI